MILRRFSQVGQNVSSPTPSLTEVEGLETKPDHSDNSMVRDESLKTSLLCRKAGHCCSSISRSLFYYVCLFVDALEGGQRLRA